MAMHEHPSHTIRFDLAVVPRRWGCNLWDAVNLIDAAKGTLVLSTTQVPTYSYSIRGYPAEAISLCSESMESTRLPSRSMAQ